MASPFDEVLPREGLSTAKWEMEFACLSNPNLLCFGTADMDFRSPPVVVDAMRAAVERGHYGYPFKGPGYYAAVQQMLRSHGWEVEPSWIATNVGIYPSMQSVIEAVTDPGDEIAFQTPVHHIFNELIIKNGRVPIQSALVVRDGIYRMDLDGLARQVTERTKAFVLCNPHNPVGRVWTRDELVALDKFCREREILIISDEVYYGLTHTAATYIPFASLSHEASLNSITLTAASKSFNLTGLKHSLVITENTELLDAYTGGLHRTNLFYGGSTLGIVATEAAFARAKPWNRELMAYIAENRKVMRQRLTGFLPEVTLYDADGTYFAWLDFRPLGLSDADLVALFEEEAELIVSHGAALGDGGAGHIRWNLACPTALLQQGLNRLENVITTWGDR